jgi:hypothetical protein
VRLGAAFGCAESPKFARPLDQSLRSKTAEGHLVEKNLKMTTEQRAQQLVNATRFLRKFGPFVGILERKKGKL